MASKPQSQWSPEYARRIARAQAKAAAAGTEFTKQLARGHKTGEHITRRQYAEKQMQEAQAAREAAHGPNRLKSDPNDRQGMKPRKLDAKERAKVRRIGRDLAKRSVQPDDAEAFKEAGDKAVAAAERWGMANFLRQVARQRERRKVYLAELSGRAGLVYIRGAYAATLEAWSQEEGGFEDIAWYYYH